MRSAPVPLTEVSRTPNGIRTRAAALKGRCPRPLDDGGATATAAMPVAPAVGDRFSIGDRRQRRQSSCREQRPACRAAATATNPPGGRLRLPARAARLALPRLVEEVLGDRRLLAFIRDDDPGHNVREQPCPGGEQGYQRGENPDEVDVHAGVFGHPGADAGDDPVFTRTEKYLAAPVRITHVCSIPHPAVPLPSGSDTLGSPP